MGRTRVRLEHLLKDPPDLLILVRDARPERVEIGCRSEVFAGHVQRDGGPATAWDHE